VRLLGVRPGSKELEAAYHEHFSSQREHAEWFRFDYQTASWMQIALRSTYSEAWGYVERTFKDQAPELLMLESRRGLVSSILCPAGLTVDEIPSRRRRCSRSNGGAE
jgi:hypothetical protein